MAQYPFRIFAGSPLPALANEMADVLGVILGKATTVQFPDTEIHVLIEEVVREVDIFFVQPCRILSMII